MSNEDTDDLDALSIKDTDDLDALRRRFTYHPPTPESVLKFAKVRAYGLVLATVVMRNSPPGQERDEAIRKIDEAVMWANAGIARSQP